MVQEGTEPLKNIIIYSIMGFFTFFMGYLGWILAQDVLDIVSGKKNHNEAELEA
jgi:TRAP-type C4-dicarboxylate transport system permease small subunit